MIDTKTDKRTPNSTGPPRLTAISASIQLHPHGNLAVPRLGVNTYKPCSDWWNYLEGYCVIDVIVSTENLWKQQ